MATQEIVKCAYCGKERPTSEMKKGTISFRGYPYDSNGRRKTSVEHKTNWYCADAPCHGYHQMAHEG